MTFGEAAFMRRRRKNIDENENHPEREKTHILDGAPGGAHPVDGVARDPHHGGEGHEEPYGMSPGWVLHSAVLDRLPSEAVEEEDDGHHAGGNDPPAKSPVEVRLEAGHLFHAVRELLHTEDPTDGDRLKR